LSSRGYAALEVAETYARARALCAQTGDDTRLLPVLYGLWVNAFVRARHDQVLELGLELRELAERHDTGVLIVAERAVGWPLICMGRFEEARVHLDRIPALHDPTGSRPPRYLYGQDPSVAGLATGAWALWGCGEEREAHARAEQAIALARGLAHPLTLAYALGAGALLAGFCRDASLARERSVEAIAVTDEYSLPLWRGWSLYALAAAELLEGDGERATATLHAGLEVARGTGAALFEPFALTVLGEAQASVGRRDAALRALEAAAAAARRTGELFWQPQTRRAQDALVAARS
jgi:adenylate cyclase